MYFYELHFKTKLSRYETTLSQLHGGPRLYDESSKEAFYKHIHYKVTRFTFSGRLLISLNHEVLFLLGLLIRMQFQVVGSTVVPRFKTTLDYKTV